VIAARKIAESTAPVVANDVTSATDTSPVIVGRRVTLSIGGMHTTGTLGCDEGLWYLHDVRGFRRHVQKLVRVGCEAEIAKHAIAWDPCRDCGADARESCDPTCRIGGAR
jgi:hypothetical protein